MVRVLTKQISVGKLPVKDGSVRNWPEERFAVRGSIHLYCKV